MKKYDVSGLSVNDILNMSLKHLGSLSRSDLARVTSRLVSAGNKRLRRFEKAGISTPASAYIEKHGGKFTTKNKNLYELREEFQRIKGFLESETATVKGYRRWESKVAETLKTRSGIDYYALNEEQKRIFWKTYAKLEEKDSANVYGAKYAQSVNLIYNAVKNDKITDDDKIDSFVKNIDKENYAESTQNLTSGMNDPFTLVSENSPFKK